MKSATHTRRVYHESSGQNPDTQKNAVGFKSTTQAKAAKGATVKCPENTEMMKPTARFRCVKDGICQNSLVIMLWPLPPSSSFVVIRQLPPPPPPPPRTGRVGPSPPRGVLCKAMLGVIDLLGLLAAAASISGMMSSASSVSAVCPKLEKAHGWLQPCGEWKTPREQGHVHEPRGHTLHDAEDKEASQGARILTTTASCHQVNLRQEPCKRGMSTDAACCFCTKRSDAGTNVADTLSHQETAFC